MTRSSFKLGGVGKAGDTDCGLNSVVRKLTPAQKRGGEKGGRVWIAERMVYAKALW